MKEQYPFVSVVIPARNSEKILGQCIKSLKNLNYPKEKYEIIIADSNSTDNTFEVAKNLGAIAVHNTGGTVCSGRNIGFKTARGEIVAFSDSDCVMDRDWIKNSIKYFEDEKIAAVGGPNLTPAEEGAFGKAVGFVFNQALFTAGSVYARILKKTKEVKSLPGCNIIFRRKALEKVLPLDESIIEAEDYVMNQKIRALGYKLMYTPDTIVWHHRRPIPKKFFMQMYRYAIGRLRLGKKDIKMINLTHILVGLGLPIIIISSLVLILVKKILFLYLFILGAAFLIFYCLFAWFKTKSFKTAVLVPGVIILLFCGWSLGFLKELLSPYNDKKLIKIYENPNR